MGFKRVVFVEFETETETDFLMANNLLFMPGLIHFQLKIQLKSAKAKILNSVDISLPEIVTFCEV